MKYLVTHQEQESGPFTLDEIVSKVRAKELELFDYIFDEAKQDWVLLMEHAELAQKLKSNKPPRPPKDTDAATATVAPTPTPTPTPSPTQAKATTTAAAGPHTIEWFVLKGENKFGPFSYGDIIKMLQQKVVFPFDFVWNAGLKDWRRLAQFEEFSETNMKKAFETAKPGLFTDRQYKRKAFTGRVIVHDNKTVWQGTGFEISKGGVGLTMTNAMVVPGQEVTVHFTETDELPAFNALCEVVSKQLATDSEPIQYGLRFLRLSPEAQDEFYKRVA